MSVQADVRRALRRRDPAPNMAEVRRLLEEKTGHGTLTRLAELLGCSLRSVMRWERGRRPSGVYADKLTELARTLRARKGSVDDELNGKTPTHAKDRPLPLPANVVSVRIEGDQALVSFMLKVPGETGTRIVAEILVPASILPGQGLLVGKVG